MSADIIPFIPRRHRQKIRTDFSAPAAADDLVMDHVDTSPCGYVWPDEGEPVSTENVNA
jgi:hypothetical protein